MRAIGILILLVALVALFGCVQKPLGTPPPSQEPNISQPSSPGINEDNSKLTDNITVLVDSEWLNDTGNVNIGDMI